MQVSGLEEEATRAKKEGSSQIQVNLRIIVYLTIVKLVFRGGDAGQEGGLRPAAGQLIVYLTIVGQLENCRLLNNSRFDPRRCRPPPLSNPLQVDCRRGIAVHRESFIDNLLVRIHFIIVMIRRTGLAPWEFEFPFPGSLQVPFAHCWRNIARIRQSRPVWAAPWEFEVPRLRQ